MAVVSSSPPPHPSSTQSAAEYCDRPRESTARPSIATGVVSIMNPQASSPLRTSYPDPIPSDAQMSAGPPYFNARRQQQQSLSQDEQDLAHSLSHDIDGQMTVLSPQVTNGQGQNFDMGSQSGLPNTPHQPPVESLLAGQHTGVDPNQDLSYSVGSDRRKRSKVSRACDECRRKKVSCRTPLFPLSINNLAQVRCDSTTSASDGNLIETCSNCRRLKVTCQFERAPMKRGPSKGYTVRESLLSIANDLRYIKELAERVQQVESQMGIPLGYRPSVDANSPSDPYPEQSYSPTEPISSSRKRTFSQFDGRNPFAQPPHSSRDKMAGQSGYNVNQGLQSGRESFALAPDQQLTDISPTAGHTSLDLAKPFWAQETEVEHPRAKETQIATAPAADLSTAESLFRS